jgi:prepilin-type processing-associated H-X9-DG protein
MSRKRLSLFEIVVIVVIVGVTVALLLPQFARRRKVMRRLACADNLKQLALALALYADENKDRFPPIDDTKNNFMFDANLLYPEYLNDHMIAMCPADPRWDPGTNFRLTSNHSVDGTPKGKVHGDCFADDSYIYLGWMVMSDKQVQALFEAYDKLSPEDNNANITVPEGWGNAWRDTIYRLDAGIDRFLITDINIIGSHEVGSSLVPIMWDRSYMDTGKFSHEPVGGNVLYLDGHAEYWFFGKEFPPINETMARLLEERPREPIPHCE